MSVTKVNADVFDLTDAYAFSGTVTGTNAGATTLISRTAFTTASTVDITGFDSSLYDSYEILMHCIVPLPSHHLLLNLCRLYQPA